MVIGKDKWQAIVAYGGAVVFGKDTVEKIKKAKLTEFNIIKATYGTTSEKTIDITERLEEQIKDNRLNVAATNKTLIELAF